MSFCRRCVGLCCVAAVGLLGSAPLAAETTGRLLGVQRVWDKAPHSAFTDLVRFQGAFYLAFREASTHGVPGVGQPGGALRILRSEDGLTWASAARLEGQPDEDLRDAKLTVTFDDRLLLEGAVAPHGAPSERQSLVWTSADGRTWSERTDVGAANDWLWGVHRARDAYYSIAYGPTNGARDAWTTRLYRSADGLRYAPHVENFTGVTGSTEGALWFADDGTAYALVRRDAGSQHASFGVSHGDFSQWTWFDAGVSVGGPELIQLPDGRLLVSGRRTDGGARTSLMWVDPTNGRLDEFLTLPSGGDTSYPGLVWHDDKLWVSYYSSHEGQSNIYVAQVEFVAAPAP